MAPGTRHRGGICLYAHPNQLESHAARIILAEKVVKYDVIYVDHAQSANEDLLQLNPAGDLPTLADREVVIPDAEIIAEYLDERYPHAPLLPADPVARARLRTAVMRIRRDWYPLLATPAKHGQLLDELQQVAPAFKTAKFFLSDEFSVADCFLAPLLWRLAYFGLELPRSADSMRLYAEKMYHGRAFLKALTPQEQQRRT